MSCRPEPKERPRQECLADGDNVRSDEAQPRMDLGLSRLCAEPMSEAAENPSPVSSGVLVTVELYVYSNKGCYCSVFGKLNFEIVCRV